MKYFPGALFISFLFVTAAQSQDIIYPVTNFTTREYGRDFHPANMAIEQDSRGMIYAANGFKILQYDGHSWRSYPINKEAWILSLAIDSQGIIYIGSQNEFGYFAPDPVLGLKYHSLSDSLNAEDMDFSNVWKVNLFSGGVAFQAEEKLFVYRNDSVIAFSPESSFHTSFAVNGILYVRQRGTGLMSFQNGRLVPESEGELFRSRGIFMMLPFGEDGKDILIGTREGGFSVFSPSSSANRFRTFKLENQALVDASSITGGTAMSDGSIALSTMTKGLIIIDRNGKIVKEINTASGLPDNDVKQVIRDRSGNLWLASNNGISMIGYSSPVTFYGDDSGIDGSVNAVLRFKGLLYCGTNTGLRIQDEYPYRQKIFRELSLNHPVRSLIEAEGVLLAATDGGIFEISNGIAKPEASDESFTLFCSPTLNYIFSGGSKGVSVFRNSEMKDRIKLPLEIKSDVIAFAEKKSDSPDSSEIWVGTRYDGVYRLTFRKDKGCKTDRYVAADGIAEGPVIPFSYNNNIIFGTIAGLYAFTDENEVTKSLPDSLKNDPDFLRGYFSSARISEDTIGISVSSLVEGRDKIWICADNKPGYIDRNKNKYVLTPFRGIDAGKINTIYPENDNVTWFGTTDGLFRYDGNKMKDYSSPYFSLIRRVTVIRSDSIIFQGTFFRRESSGLRPAAIQPDDMKPQLRYSDNSLRFDFAALFYEHPDKMTFSCFLEGYDNGWTGWEYKYYQDYTNLHEGSYVFHVKARNVFNQVSEESVYSFSVLPPWYRSYPAYILYFIAGIVFIWLLIRLYTLRLKRENIRLEGIVRERTAEVVQQRDILEHQKNEIEDSIRYASRIQAAVLPADQEFMKLAPESFVFFRPRDIVSGDFYWISKVAGKLVISAADCTGHGVPGAFMSMLGVAFLDEIVNRDHITNPDSILNRLRGKVIEALQQQGISGEAKDGMDIVVITVDQNEYKLMYAGAYNPLIMIRNGELSEFRADRMPIAIFDSMRDFRSHEIKIQKGDLFYFSSDGYEDQFGGPEGKKFKSRQFKELLLKVWDKPMDEQKDIIIRTFDDWKGEMNQVDDIVVIGVRIL